jgi:hypothetical protein
MHKNWTRIIALVLAALMAVSGLGVGIVALMN